MKHTIMSKESNDNAMNANGKNYESNNDNQQRKFAAIEVFSVQSLKVCRTTRLE